MSRIAFISSLASFLPLFQAETGTATASPPAAAVPAEFKLEQKYFAPAELAAASEYAAKAAAKFPAANRLNFDPEKGTPDNFGILVQPISRRIPNKGQMTVGVAIAAVPSVELLRSLPEDKGEHFILDAVLNSYARKIVSSLKPDANGKLPAHPSLPASLEDFIENRRLATTYGYFSEFVKKIMESDLKKRAPFITPVIIRQCFQSKSYAQSFPAVPDAVWVKMLDAGIAKGQASGGDVSQMVNWKATRDETAITIDVGDIDELLADLDDEEGNEGENGEANAADANAANADPTANVNAEQAPAA